MAMTFIDYARMRKIAIYSHAVYGNGGGGATYIAAEMNCQLHFKYLCSQTRD